MSAHRVLIVSFIVAVSAGMFRVALGRETPNQEGVGANTAQPRPNPQQVTVSSRAGALDDYRVGVGDTLDIQVVDHIEMNQTVRVAASGEITIHPAGSLRVEDMTPAELESSLASLLQEKELLKRPEVLVFVREYQAKRVYMIGEFERPGEFVMSKRLTLMDAIFIAGGLRPFADTVGYLHRRVSRGKMNERPPANLIDSPGIPREGTQILAIDLQPLADARAVKPNITLKEGDTFIVPRRQLESFFVLGEVLRPSSYFYPAGETMMASRAISEAGGPSPFARISKGVIIRYDKAGGRQEIKADFDAILKGKKEDIAVLRNDIIYIPSSNLKVIGERYLGLTNQMIEGTVFRYAREAQVQNWVQDSQPGAVAP